MTTYASPPNRYPDLAHPPPHDPPIDVGVETHTWRQLWTQWQTHACAADRGACPRCSQGDACATLSAYGQTLSGILHRATLWGPVR